MRNADAARLLAAARSAEALLPLARALGFTGEVGPFGRDAEAALAGACGVGAPRVVAGPGPRRAVLAAVPAGGSARERAVAVARHLAREAPAVSWLVMLAQADGAEVAIAAPHAERAGVRVGTLLCDPRRVLPSDAETLCALAAARDVGARWVDLLGREAVARTFYRRLERAVRALATSAVGAGDARTRDALALLHASRLLFLAFLEAKGWLDGDHGFLRRGFDACMATGGGYHARVLRPLFFGTLNTPWSRRAAAARRLGRVPFLNGGLFAPTPIERRCRALRLDDAALGHVVVGLLGGHRFSPREDARGSCEAAIDPEMLGRAFESLMATDERRATGAFYTPQALVEHATGEALRTALAPREGPSPSFDASDVDALLGGARPDGGAAHALRARLAALRVVDPACGSGAFLVHALERVATLAGACGDACGDPRGTAAVRREVLARSIFGVDVNPTAVWLCELRLWLSVVVESDDADPMAVAPLPNLDHHVRVGDSLAAAAHVGAWGGDPWCATGASAVAASGGGRIARMRERYARASGPRKRASATALDAAERDAAITALERSLDARRAERGDLLAAARGRDLFGGRRGSAPAERRRLAALREECRALAARRRALRAGVALPFGFAWHYPDIAARGGFDLVTGYSGDPGTDRFRDHSCTLPPRTHAESLLLHSLLHAPPAVG